MSQKIIALIGMCGSGKSVAGNILSEKGYTRLYYGGFTMRELKKRNLEINEDNERKIREELRKKYGMGAFAILSFNDIDNYLKNNELFYIDGLYSWSEYKELMNRYGDQILLIEIFANKEIRYKRLSQRKERPLTKEKARERDIKEIENIEKGGPIAFSDYKIENNDNLQQVKIQLEKIINKISK